MEQLIQTIKALLADNITLSFKSHGYHWNVEGDDFAQFHDFFGKIYDNYNDATDTYAEWLRMLSQYSPYRLVDFFDTSTVGEPEIVGDAQLMLNDLYSSIEKHIADLIIAGKMATALNEFGLANFFADRQTISQKFCWQIRASIEIEDSETLI